MTQLERFKYFGACRPPQALGSFFGDHAYDEDVEDTLDDEHAADVGSDEDDRPPS